MLKQANKVLNQATVFFIGLLLGASYFLFFLQTFYLGGAVFAITSALAINYLINKLNVKKNTYLKWGNIGLFSFNIGIAIIGIAVYSTFFVAFQGLIS